MKSFLLPLVATLAGAGPASAQFNISLLSKQGLLMWTNSISNATYRVEWAASPTGAWQRFDTPTNLNSLTVTSTTVSVQVPQGQAPTFYRVVWSDAAPFAGLYELSEYDLDGNLVVTGRLWLAREAGAIEIDGTRELYPGPGATNTPSSAENVFGPQFGVGPIGGAGFSPNTPSLTVGLSPPLVFDNNVVLDGYPAGNIFLGQWYWHGYAWTLARGYFIASRLNAGKPDPAAPLGTWRYFSFGSSASGSLDATGQIAFATSENPLSGTWAFGPRTPSMPYSHLVGQGVFTNALASGNHIAISIPATNAEFRLEGEMAGDVFAGFGRWATSAQPVQLMFEANRLRSP